MGAAQHAVRTGHSGIQARCVTSKTHTATKLPCLLFTQMDLLWEKLPGPPALQSSQTLPAWQMAGTHPAKSLDAARAPVLEH